MTHCKKCGRFVKKGNTFCNPQCRGLFLRGKSRGGEGKAKHHIRIRVKNGNGKSERVYLHRFLMQKAIGRELEPHEIVHHKDENIFNNSLDNLQITTAQEHIQLHSWWNNRRKMEQLAEDFATWGW
jgi:hypothetical protein